ESIDVLCTKQMVVLAAMGFVTGRASLLEGGLMQEMLFALLGLVGVATQADVHGVRPGQPRLPAGMRIVAIGAVPGRSRMRHFCLINFFCLLAVAGHTERFRIGLREHHFSVLGRSMAKITGLVCERRMQELPHQFRGGRLMGIVATGAVRRRKGLIVMRLLQACVLGVVAVETKRRSALGQMKVELGLACQSSLVGRMAGVAPQVEGGMTAALFGDVQSLFVAIETEILTLISRLGFQ